VDEDLLERYSMGTVTEAESERIEQHLLVCQTCRNRLQEDETFLRAMREAAGDLERTQPPPRPSFWWRPLPAFAAAAVALLLVFAGVRFFQSGPALPPVAVTLQATRGAGIEGNVPANRPLVLKLDVSTLDVQHSHRVEIVDQSGREVWSGKADRVDSNLPVAIPGLRAGIYFVRVYATEGRLLREYGLEVRG
jgi:hypothetical protein